MARTHHSASGAGPAQAAAEHVHAVPLPILLGVWGILVVLTWVTVAATKVDLGGLNIVIALLIAVVKSSFVALYFMHLRYDRPFHSVIFIGALLFIMLFISFALLDTREYRPTFVGGEAPAVALAMQEREAAAEGGAGSGGGPAMAGVVAASGAASAAAPEAGGPIAASAALLEGLAKADPKRGDALYHQTCIACHGPGAAGVRALNSPALFIQEDWYLATQLTKFRRGIRGTDPKDIPGMQMAPMAKTLPDDQAMYDLAAYISSLDGELPPNEIVGADRAAGETHYKQVCIACHGPDGRGVRNLHSPSLVGQSDWYLVNQLEKFKGGLRGYSTQDVTGAQMRPMAMTLADEAAMKNVAAYIASLPWNGKTR